MKLLEPIAIGGRTAPNRVMFGPHVTNLGRGRALSERHLAYYRRRIAGGVGVLVTEEASVHASDWPYERSPLATHCGPGWRQLADAASESTSGALIIAALGHAGGQGSSAYSQAAMWAPSGEPEVNTREVPKIMEPEDIAAVIAGFGAATELAIASGLDGVEVNAGQHSLVRQFMSGLTNKRADEYGESDRLRFAREVLTAVRKAAGDAIVGLRLSCDELAPWAGITPDAAAEIAVELGPWLDYIVVVRGSIFSVSETRPNAQSEPGFNLDLTSAVRAALDPRVHVVAQGSIIDVGQANWAVDDGRCQIVEMTRAQIAEPDLARLAATHPEHIRPCILCNQTCQVRDARNPIVTCVGEPRSGHETEDSEIPVDIAPGQPKGQLLIVGAGIAGMEAARVAALSGWHPIVADRNEATGGLARVAARSSGHRRIALLADWLRDECLRLGVEFRLGATVTDAEVTAHDGPVLLCTGGVAGNPTFIAEPDAVVVTPEQVLQSMDERGPALPDGASVVWDPIGGPIGVSIAETLAAAGRDVTLVTPDNIVGNELSRSGDLAGANVRLQVANVSLRRRSLLRRAASASVEIEDRFTAASTVLPAAFVVDAGHRLPNEALWQQTGESLARAGDCVAPRTIHEAVLEARREVLAITAPTRLPDRAAQ